MTLREKFIAILSRDVLSCADAIVVLEGDGLNRVKYACELYNEFPSSKIVFSGGVKNCDYGSYPLEMLLEEFEKHNVQKSEIIHEEKSLNTKEQAHNVVNICIEKNWKSLLLVASNFHQYRAFLTFLN